MPKKAPPETIEKARATIEPSPCGLTRRAFGPAVEIVSVVVAAVPAVTVIGFGKKLHEPFVNDVTQVNVMVPLNPFIGVTVMVDVPCCPWRKVREVGLALIV